MGYTPLQRRIQALITNAPRTPNKRKRPLFFALRAFPQKEGGRMRANPWISAYSAHKSLIVEQNAPTDCTVFSTGCDNLSTDCTVFSTGAVFVLLRRLSIYLSIFKEERERRRAPEKNKGIHGLAQLLIFSSTGYDPIHGLTRGNTWITKYIYIIWLSDIFDASTHPRVVLPLGGFGLLDERCFDV